MAPVEPVINNYVDTSAAEGSTMQGGKFKDAQVEQQYRLFKLDYHKPSVFIFIIQLLLFNVGSIMTSSVNYSSTSLTHIIVMVAFLLINIGLIILFYVTSKAYKSLVLFAMTLYTFLQIYIDVVFSAYTVTPVTSLPWLLVVMVTSYTVLPFHALLCVLLSSASFVGYSLLTLLLMKEKYDGPSYGIPNVVSIFFY